MILEPFTCELLSHSLRVQPRVVGASELVVSSRPPDGQSGRPSVRRRVRSGLLLGVVSIVRLGFLAIIRRHAQRPCNVFHSDAVSRTVGAPSGVTFLALTMTAASAVLMVALTLNTAFLVDRLFSRRVAPYLTGAVFILAAGASLSDITAARSWDDRNRDRSHPDHRIRAEHAPRARRRTSASARAAPRTPHPEASQPRGAESQAMNGRSKARGPTALLPRPALTPCARRACSSSCLSTSSWRC